MAFPSSKSLPTGPSVGIYQFAPYKGIQVSLRFGIPSHGFRIPGTGFQSLVGFRIFLKLYSGFKNPRIPDSRAKMAYMDTEFCNPEFPGFRNPDSPYIDESEGVPDTLNQEGISWLN